MHFIIAYNLLHYSTSHCILSRYHTRTCHFVLHHSRGTEVLRPVVLRPVYIYIYTYVSLSLYIYIYIYIHICIYICISLSLSPYIYIYICIHIYIYTYMYVLHIIIYTVDNWPRSEARMRHVSPIASGGVRLCVCLCVCVCICTSYMRNLLGWVETRLAQNTLHYLNVA